MSNSAANSLAEDLKRLNEQQRAIIKKFNRPSLIVAGPGTGKTRTVSVLIGDLLQKGVRGRNGIVENRIKQHGDGGGGDDVGHENQHLEAAAETQPHARIGKPAGQQQGQQDGND